jgi:hypothetical protein
MMRPTWNIARAREMRANGMSYDSIGLHFGIPGSTVNTRLNPNYAAARREDVRRSRRKKRESVAAVAEAWDENVARQMREDGQSYKVIGKRFGVDGHVAHARLDAEYAEHRRNRNKKAASETKQVRSHVRAAIDDREAYRQFANFPRDTRSLTGRLAGDPLPGRSALDMRKQQETRI